MRNWLIASLVVVLAAFSIAQTTRIAASPGVSSTQPARVTDAQAGGDSRRRNNSRRQRRPSRDNVAARDTGATSLPQIYELVATRDIFVKGQQYVNPAASQPRESTRVIDYGGGLGAAATELVLTGVVQTDVGQVAFLENDNEQKVFRVQVGEEVSGGKITGISLDSIEFKDGRGAVTHVDVGSNLAGGDVWGVAGSPAASASTEPTSSGNPAVDAILQKMRERRLQELGGK